MNTRSMKVALGGPCTAVSAVVVMSLLSTMGCEPVEEPTGSLFNGALHATEQEAPAPCEEELLNDWCDVSCWTDATCTPRSRTDDEIGAVAQPSSSRLALSLDERHAVVALEDRGEVVLVDLERHEVEQRYPLLGTAPHRVTSLGARGFAVSLKRTGQVALLSPALREVGRVTVGAAPYGMLALDDGQLAVAVSGEDAIVFVDLEEQVVTRRLKTPARDPRGLARLPDGRVLVAHFSPGRLTVLASETHEVLATVAPDHADLGLANHLEQVMVSPTSGEVHLVMQLCNDDPARFTDGQSFVSENEPPPPSAYYTGALTGSPAVVGTTSTLSLEAGETSPEVEHEVYNPLVAFPQHVGASAMVVVDGGRAALVVHKMSGTFNLRDKVQADPFREDHGDIGIGADTVVASRDGRRAWLFNPFTRALFAYELGYLGNDEGDTLVRMQFRSSAVLGDEVLPAEVVRGRRLFHSVNGWMTTSSAIACASCHPDGHDDGITWQFAQGPRQTQPLWGDVFASGPVHWDLEVANVEQLSEVTIVGRMGGEGLLGVERQALAAFLAAIPVPAAPTDLDPLKVVQGRALFEDPAIGCTDCHVGPRLRDGLAHDVGTSAGALARETLEAVATPTLLGVGASAPYLHDGSALTLNDLVERYVRTDLMGTGSHLSDPEAAALVAYLKSL